MFHIMPKKGGLKTLHNFRFVSKIIGGEECRHYYYNYLYLIINRNDK